MVNYEIRSQVDASLRFAERIGEGDEKLARNRINLRDMLRYDYLMFLGFLFESDGTTAVEEVKFVNDYLGFNMDVVKFIGFVYEFADPSGLFALEILILAALIPDIQKQGFKLVPDFRAVAGGRFHPEVYVFFSESQIDDLAAERPVIGNDDPEILCRKILRIDQRVTLGLKSIGQQLFLVNGIMAEQFFFNHAVYSSPLRLGNAAQICTACRRALLRRVKDSISGSR